MNSKVFKVINGLMAVFCAGIMYVNHVDVDLLNSENATSSIASDTFSYQSTENSFSFTKNGHLVGWLPTERKINFKSRGPVLQCNAVVVGAKGIIAGGAALAGGAASAVAPTAALSSIGFGSGGIIAGSLAASAQSAIANVASGSIFAWLTSAGTAAATASVIAPAAIIGTLGFGLA